MEQSPDRPPGRLPMTAGHPTGLVVVLLTGYRRSRSIRSGVDAVVRDPEKASSPSRRSPTLMFLAVVLAALIMLAKASCWAFTMVSANSDQDLKTCFQASSTGAKASMPAEARAAARAVNPARCPRRAACARHGSRRTRGRRGGRGCSRSSRFSRESSRSLSCSSRTAVRFSRRSVLSPSWLFSPSSRAGLARRTSRARWCPAGPWPSWVELPWTAGNVRAIALPHGEDQCSAHCRGGPASWIRRSILRYHVHASRR